MIEYKMPNFDELGINKESLCKQCGKCCHKSVKFEGKGYWITGHPCAYLDTRTNMCTIYGDRFNIPDAACLSLDKAIEGGALDKDCGYVSFLGLDRNRFKEEISEKDLIKVILKERLK